MRKKEIMINIKGARKTIFYRDGEFECFNNANEKDFEYTRSKANEENWVIFDGISIGLDFIFSFDVSHLKDTHLRMIRHAYGVDRVMLFAFDYYRYYTIVIPDTHNKQYCNFSRQLTVKKQAVLKTAQTEEK